MKTDNNTNCHKLASILTLLVAIGCGSPSTNSSTNTLSTSVAAPQKIRLATSKNMWCALPLIAKARNYFREENIEVEFNYQTAGRFCMDAVVSNSADIGNVVEVNVSYIAFSSTSNVKIVATCVTSTGSTIVYRKDRGIKGLSDLKGKSLGYSPGTTSDIYANWLLEDAKMPAASLKLVKLQPPALQAAMVAGSIDAASTWEPFASNIRKSLGTKVAEIQRPDLYVGSMNVAVGATFLSKHLNETRAFLRALKKAEKFVKEHPGEAQQLLSQEAAMPLDVVKSTWKYYDFSLGLDIASLKSANEKEGKFILGSSPEFKGKPLPNYSNFYDGEPLQSMGASN